MSAMRAVHQKIFHEKGNGSQQGESWRQKRIEELQKENKALLQAMREIREQREEQVAGEDFFRIIFEHSPLAIMCTDEQGVITAANEKAVVMFGAERHKLIGFSFSVTRNRPVAS